MTKRRSLLAAPFALGAVLTLTPWLARNVLLTGNPVYPFLGSVFAPIQGPAADLTQGIAENMRQMFDIDLSDEVEHFAEVKKVQIRQAMRIAV